MDSNPSQFDDLSDGSGCIEIAEHLSEQRNQNDDCPAPIDEDPILNQIGNTPLVQHPDNDQIYCKLERENPTLSHKDRLGVGMIRGLREKGILDPGQRVVEASSGNTAGAVALAANRLGHPCTIVMRETGNTVKMGFVKALGAELVEAPDVSNEHDQYYQKVAKAFAQEHDAVFLNQYERELNPEVHYRDIGQELLKQIDGEEFTHIVAATSTGGIVSGIGRAIKEVDSSIQIIAVDGEESNISRAFHGEDMGDYDSDIEGLGQWRVTDAIDFSVIDEVRSVSDSTAISRVKHEARDNGLLMGTSSGAAMEVAQDITQDGDRSKVITVIHDGIEQYFHHIYE